jgi:hypothetical protein
MTIATWRICAMTTAYYRNPVPLRREAGLALSHKPAITHFSHAAHIHSTVLGAIELFPASRDYPIVFAASQKGRLLPLAVLGLRSGENLFVDSSDQWLAGHCIPAFVRQIRIAEAFARRLDELGLLVEDSVRLDMRTGQRHAINEFRVVNEASFDALDDKTLRELRASGYLKLIVAHLISLGNLGELPDRLAPRLVNAAGKIADEELESAIEPEGAATTTKGTNALH